MPADSHPHSNDHSEPDPYRLQAKGIRSPAVLDAFRKIHRKDFLNPELQHLADFDGPIPIGAGQTISQPSLVAYMTQMLDITPMHHVLEIGTGSGYQTAVLAELASHVTTVEIIKQLHDAAQDRLTAMGYKNIECILGSGHCEISPGIRYDRIMVTAAADECPQILLDQLAENGKMIIPLGPEHDIQYICLFNKNSRGKITQTTDIAVRFVPFVKP